MPTVFLICLVISKDGMAIKPGFQFDRRTKEIIGGEKIFADMSSYLIFLKSVSFLFLDLNETVLFNYSWRAFDGVIHLIRNSIFPYLGI